MPELMWNQTGQKTYRTGVKKVVLYPQDKTGAYPKGVAWNGVTNITDSPSGAEPTDLWADDEKYASIRSNEEFSGSLEAYMYPDEWAACDGSAELLPGVRVRQQSRQSFGLCYRTGVGNDTEGLEYGYTLHLVYGATASPSEESHDTVNDSPEASTMSWEFDTVPVEVPDLKKSAHLEINSWTLSKEQLTKLESILYGGPGDNEVARLPLPAELKEILTAINSGTTEPALPDTDTDEDEGI